MKSTTLSALSGAIVLSAAWLFPAWAAERTADPAAAPAPKSADWKDDPTCRMVYFAVLEGLFTDGVPGDVADAVVPRAAAEGGNPVKTSFVVECPLCHPVYEAFALYQRRPAFNDDAKRDTFGSGLKPELAAKLKDPTPRTRLVALRELVHQWVERRLTSMRLTEAERAEWTKKLAARSNEGRTQLIKLMRSDPKYNGWSTYWGCAACNGTEDACRELRNTAGRK